MTLDLSFKELCELLKKDRGKLAELADKVLGLTLLCTSLVGPQITAALPSLAAKNEIVKLLKGGLELLSKKKDKDYIARYQRMQIAYSLICFTSFFEALDKKIPDNLRDRIALLKEEKWSLVEAARSRTTSTASSVDTSGRTTLTDPLLALPIISFPHPTESLNHQKIATFAALETTGAGFPRICSETFDY